VSTAEQEALGVTCEASSRAATRIAEARRVASRVVHTCVYTPRAVVEDFLSIEEDVRVAIGLEAHLVAGSHGAGVS
jgi:hypothetical protein